MKASACRGAEDGKQTPANLYGLMRRGCAKNVFQGRCTKHSIRKLLRRGCSRRPYHLRELRQQWFVLALFLIVFWVSSSQVRRDSNNENVTRLLRWHLEHAGLEHRLR